MVKSVFSNLATITSLLLALNPCATWALRAPDLTGDDAGAVVVYDFANSGDQTVIDSSGVTPGLNLSASTAGNLPTADGTQIRTNMVIQNNYLLMNPKPNGAPMSPDQGYQSAQRHRTFMISDVAATKLNSCTNGFTIQAFIRPWFPFQGNTASGNLILGLSNSEGLTSAAVEPNIGLYQSGMAGAEAISLHVRTGADRAVTQTSVAGAFSSVREGDNPGKLTEVIATQEPSGVLTVYVNRISRTSLTAVTPMFTSTAKLVIGNELIPLSGTATNVDVSQQRNWSGEIYHVAIYCKGFSRSEILGGILDNKAKGDVVRPNATGDIDSAQQDARRMVERLTGVTVPVDHPMVLRVADKIRHGDRLGGAKIVTGDKTAGEPGAPEFLNTLVKKMALRLSNREESMRANLNDLAASFIGVTRDDRSAQELLTDDFYYAADPTKANVRHDVYRDMVLSNNHYDDLETGGWDLGKVLVRVTGQQIAVDEVGKLSPSPDPAGVLTSRAFMSSHAIAGTNRRLVEYTFREFMCVHMNEMADTAASPARIGRDVDRSPAGDQVKFETSCKGCHSVMDGYRGAFAKYDFGNVMVNGQAFNYIRHTQVNTSGALAFGKNVDQYGTVLKMNHNETVFPNGYITTDDSFINNAVGKVNGPMFGWAGSNKAGGTGVHQFGRMIADSNRFAQCMAKHVYRAVCNPNLPDDSSVDPVIEGLASHFRANGYKLRTLFQETAAHPNCAQAMGR